jgi:hypothetical protein
LCWVVAVGLCWLIRKFVAPPTLSNVLTAVVVIVVLIFVLGAVFGWSPNVLNVRIGK